MSGINDSGKLPPQAPEIEDVILGSLLLEKDAVLKVIGLLKPECFYKEQNQLIYKAILTLFESGKGIDLMTVSNQLRSSSDLDSVGGIYYLSQLLNSVSSAYHVIQHSRIIFEKYIQREFIRFGQNLSEQAFDDSIDIADLMDSSQAELYKICNSNASKTSKSIGLIGKERVNELYEISKSENKFTGVPSGFTKLDRITSGWQNSDLIIIGARPSQGKTAIALEYAVNAAKFGISVDFYSLEMSEKQLFDRALSRESGVENGFIRTAKMSEQQWISIETAIGVLEKLPLYIDDTPALRLTEFRAKAISNKMKNKTGLIIVDYLQLMQGEGNNRESEIASISRGLKAVAKELDVPVIALSQLNRAVEGRAGKRPQLSDLRESGQIEQDADIVIFIHRPEYYGIMQDENHNSTVNLIELIMAKDRNGPLVDVNLYKNNNWTEISDSKDFEFPVHYTNNDLDDIKPNF